MLDTSEKLLIASSRIQKLEAERDAARQEADQNAALVGEYRSVIEQMLKSAYPHPVEHPTMTEAWSVAATWLSVAPPGALERVQREAAAKALEETVERLRSMGTDGASAYAIARNTAVAEMIVDIRKRAAELREGK